MRSAVGATDGLLIKLYAPHGSLLGPAEMKNELRPHPRPPLGI
jgi:hypothetical protein